MILIKYTSLSALLPGNRKSRVCNILSVFNFYNLNFNTASPSIPHSISEMFSRGRKPEI